MPRQNGLGWDLESLSRAYHQGYAAGYIGMARDRCPYRGDVVISAWEAGWEDGAVTLAEAQKVQRVRIA